jgi:hypothetical protein
VSQNKANPQSQMRFVSSSVPFYPCVRLHSGLQMRTLPQGRDSVFLVTLLMDWSL